MDKAAVLAVIRELSTHCSYGYVAERLNRLGIPSGPSGAKWNRGTVYKLSKAHGIRCTYSPTMTATTPRVS
jgi:hypothetical protein